MRLKLKTKFVEIFTETTANQILVLAIICITVLEAVNMLTTKYDSGLFQTVVATIAGLSTGTYAYKKKKRKEEQKE